MKRSWIGFGILLALLLLCLLTAWAMDHLQSPIARQLDQAAAFAQEGQWEQAKTLAESAQTRWKQVRGLTACVADHTPMEEIDSLLAGLSCYGEEELADFGAACAGLSQKVQAMADAHCLNWWSFL